MTATAANDGNGDAQTRSGIFLWGLLLVALSLLTYWPTKDFGFIWDDNDYVFANKLLVEPGALWTIWTKPTASPQYYPVVFTMFWAELRLWGLDNAGRHVAGGYHLVNVVFHGLGAAAFWLALRRLKVPGAWLAAAIFVVHPVNVETVVWVSERKNVMSALFYFVALLAYMRFSPLEDNASSHPRDWRWYAVMIVSFALALASKSVTCTLPAAILVLKWWKTARIRWRDVWPLLPLFAMGFAYGLLTMWMEKSIVYGKDPIEHVPLVDRFLIAGRVAWFYAGKVVWPMDLAFVYPRWVIDSSQGWQWLYPIAAVVLIVMLWVCRKRLGRGPLAGVLLFGGTLFPALGFFYVYPFQYTYVADHYQYLAAAWLIGLVIAVGAMLLRRVSWGDALAAPISFALLLPQIAMTWKHQFNYRDTDTVNEFALLNNPDCWAAHYNLSGDRLAQNRTDDAIWHGREAIRIKPDYNRAHHNLGMALLTKGLVAEAEQEFRIASQLRPNDGVSRLSLGMALELQGRDRMAEVEIREAMRLEPRLVEGADPLAADYANRGKVELALAVCDAALQVDPDNEAVQRRRDAIVQQQATNPPVIKP